MFTSSSAILKHSFPLLNPCAWVGIQAAGLAVAPRTTPENLSKAVSIASKRIKEKPAKSSDKQPKAKPPRGVSAYNLFLKDEVVRLRSLDNTIPTKDLFKTVAKSWNALPAALREPYLQKAGESQEEATKLKASIKANARPINPYAKFIQEIIPSLRSSYPGLGAAELMKRAAEAWKLVTPGEKKRRKDQYQATLSEWRAKHEPTPDATPPV